MIFLKACHCAPLVILVILKYYGSITLAAKGDDKGKGSKPSTPKPTTPGGDIDPDDAAALQECSTKWQKIPHIKKRFSDVVLREHCKHGAKWVKQAKVPHPAKPSLSADQLKWLTGIWKCKDLLCICRAVPLCNKFLGQLEGGLDKLKGLSDGLNAKFNDLNSFFKNGSTGSAKERVRIKRQTLQQVNDIIQGKVGKASRKEIRMLNQEERAAFFRGMNKLKQEKIGDKSKYDMLVIYHTPEQSPEAHFCAAFFPFHRELLKSIEVAMRELEPMAALPFWDPTMDQPLPDPKDSLIWTDEFLGNGEGSVTTGPFATWKSLPDSQVQQFANSINIQRSVGTSPYGSLLKDSDIDTILGKGSFRDMSYCIDPFLELIHGSTHMWVGGHMLELRTSPNDPSFFLYHAFIDSVWERWRQQKQNLKQRETDYPSDQDACNSYCFASATMKPFSIKNSDGLSNAYVDQLFNYEPKPSCNGQTKDCSSPYLFCDSKTVRCVGKVKVNGNCTGYESEDICYKSRCRSGRCVVDDVVATVAATFPPLTIAPITLPPITLPVGVPTTTTPITMPPLVVTVPPTGAPVKTVWIPITVVNQVGKDMKAYPDAMITSTDLVHGVKFSGVVSDASKPPYYTGASFAQVLNPFSVSDGVQANIQVFDDNMQECTSMCLSPSTNLYEPCVANVSLSSNILSKQDIVYSPDFEQARVLNWQGTKRLPDKFFFMCHAPDTVGTTPVIDIITKASQVVPTTTVPTIVVIKNETGGISVDITSKTDITAKIMNGGCRNLHRCCVIWSGVGECKRNPWMQLSCQRDCGVCQDGVDIEKAGCVDYHTDCKKWAGEKQCNANPNWMEENCKKSCDVCTRSMSQLLVLCGVSGGAEKCIDTNNKCKDWAADEECERNPWWMKENCAVSCNSCKKKTNVFLF